MNRHAQAVLPMLLLLAELGAAGCGLPTVSIDVQGPILVDVTHCTGSCSKSTGMQPVRTAKYKWLRVGVSPLGSRQKLLRAEYSKKFGA